jgi:predicted acyl esterase
MLNVSFRTGLPLSKGKYPGFNPRTEQMGGILCDYDVTVVMRDGVSIYANVFRPAAAGKYPVLVAWAPYGKHGRIKYKYFPKCGVCDGDLSPLAIFEAADPAYWCPKGYVVLTVDPRGSWNSQGDLMLLGEQEAQDGYDLIEWAGTQSWSNGKVGMHGVSYLAWSQWKVAALNPPHLAAINPWEGASDFYRELAFHGGIPETAFLSMWLPSVSFSNTRVEDLVDMARKHPLFDEYWESKNAELSRITVPAFVVASWADHGLHARGTLEAFKQIRSSHKWLLIHGRKKWEFFYQHVEKQRQFFDCFLKGIKSEVRYWPTVTLEVRERFYVGNFRSESEWPLARTEYVPLFLNPTEKRLQKSPLERESKLGYSTDTAGDNPQNAAFVHVFEERTEITGYMKLKLWVQAEGSDDMDLFVAIQKLDRSGDIVPFQYFSNHEDGPVALGWLRVSHRELDQQKSTPCQPFHKHQNELKLKDGEIVPIEIEIWPSSTLFEPGESMRLVVQGSDIYTYQGEMNNIAHTATVNRGIHVLHAGGKYDSYLLVPVIPAVG